MQDQVRKNSFRTMMSLDKDKHERYQLVSTIWNLHLYWTLYCIVVKPLTRLQTELYCGKDTFQISRRDEQDAALFSGWMKELLKTGGRQKMGVVCDSQESNLGLLLGRQLCSPLYHNRTKSIKSGFCVREKMSRLRCRSLTCVSGGMLAEKWQNAASSLR